MEDATWHGKFILSKMFTGVKYPGKPFLISQLGKTNKSMSGGVS